MKIVVNNRPLRGRITAPPSKSETQRALLLTHLAGGTVENALNCEDTRAMERCLKALDGGGVMDAGGSATALRLIIPVAIAKNGGGVFRADDSLVRRPLDAYGAIGASIEYSGDTVRISGRLLPGEYEIDASVSSQFASGMLIALAYLGGGRLKLKGAAASRPYIDMTVDMLRRFGAKVSEDGDAFTVGGALMGAHICVQGDWSYAANFFAANALGGGVEVAGLDPDSLQGDRAVTELLKLRRMDVCDTPDLLPCLMAAACGVRGDTVFTGTRRLKYKESDRPTVMCGVINALGGSAEALEDAVAVHGTGRLTGGELTAADHRIAMAAALLGPICEKNIVIHKAQCVDKSAPGFWRDIQRLGGTDEQLGQ